MAGVPVACTCDSVGLVTARGETGDNTGARTTAPEALRTLDGKDEEGCDAPRGDAAGNVIPRDLGTMSDFQSLSNDKRWLTDHPWVAR